MIVERITVYYKTGKADEGTKLVTEAFRRSGLPGGWRTYLPSIGVQLDTACTELEFENMSERDQFWERWLATDHFKKIFAAYEQLIAKMDIHEIWTIAGSSTQT